MLVVLASPPTQYRLYGRLFYRSRESTNSIKVGLLNEKNARKVKKTQKKQTKYSNTINRHTYNPIVYNNTMG